MLSIFLKKKIKNFNHPLIVVSRNHRMGASSALSASPIMESTWKLLSYVRSKDSV